MVRMVPRANMMAVKRLTKFKKEGVGGITHQLGFEIGVPLALGGSSRGKPWLYLQGCC